MCWLMQEEISFPLVGTEVSEVLKRPLGSRLDKTLNLLLYNTIPSISIKLL